MYDSNKSNDGSICWYSDLCMCSIYLGDMQIRSEDDKFLERQRKCDGCFGAAWGDCDHCSLNGDDEEEDGEEK